MTKRKHLLIVAISLIYNSIIAQESECNFTNVEQVIRYALTNNPELNVYLLQEKKAVANYKKSKNRNLPTLSGTASFQNNLSLQETALPGEIFGQPGQNVNVQIGQQYNYNVGINLSKDIFNRETYLQEKISKIGTDITNAETDLYKQTLKEQIAFYYFTSLVGKEAVRISQEDLKVCDSIYQLTVKKFDQGIVDITAKNQAEINNNNVKQNLLANQNIYESALNNLKLLLGLPYNTKLNITEDIMSNNWVFPKRISITKDKSILLKDLQKKQTSLKLKKEKSTYLPKLSLNSYFGKQQLRDNFEVSFKDQSWTDFSYVNLSLNVPIFSGFLKKNKIKMATIDAEISDQNLQLERQEAALKDAELFSQYERNTSKLKSSKSNFKLTKENTHLAMLKYHEGIIGYSEYLKLYEDYLKAENAYLNSVSETFSQLATILSRQGS